MDKNKLLKDIAQIQKQIFALTAFAGFILVTAATILGKGYAPYLIFRNAVFGLLGFGCLGFLWGKMYARIVEKPLIQSYNKEAQQDLEPDFDREQDQVSMDVSVSELMPGMKVIDPVQDQNGTILVREGAVLTERLILTLQENGIDMIKIEAQRQYKEEEEV